MKVVHVPYCYPPEPVGGTEVYVEALAHGLEDHGVESLIAAPGERNTMYTHHGLMVRRFAMQSAGRDPRGLYGYGDAEAAQEFGRVLDVERPDVVHIHALTKGVSLLLVRQAKCRRMPVVFSYHTPTVSCLRGTLLRWGSAVCDGVLDVSTCAGCTLHGLGLGAAGSVLMSKVPPSVGRAIGASRQTGGLWTALRMTELVELRHAVFRACVTEVDHIVAVCQWVKQLLVKNGVPAAKITVSQHGLPPQSGNELPPSQPRGDRPLRIAHMGRLEPIKGTHVLVQALRSLPHANVELHIFGIVQSATSSQYLGELKRLAAGDNRISFFPAVASTSVVGLLRTYDTLAVPSQWLETGPLVVLEAFAAGIPVVGSRLGGIAELVEHEVNGLLVEAGSQREWTRMVERLANDPRLLDRLRAGVHPPRSSNAVALDMLALYRMLMRAS
jgi:glycosyltransferase involved in cell wall biosynthesis